MKFLAALLLSLTSLSVFSAEDFSQYSLKKVLKVASCQVQIKERAVVFSKDQGHALSNKLVFTSHEVTHYLRRLKKGRTLTISGMTKKEILVEDASLSSLCVLDLKGKKCDRNIDKLSIAQIQEKSGHNVKIICKRDPVQDI